jgi:hypothetical protein
VNKLKAGGGLQLQWLAAQWQGSITQQQQQQQGRPGVLQVLPRLPTSQKAVRQSVKLAQVHPHVAL